MGVCNNNKYINKELKVNKHLKITQKIGTPKRKILTTNNNKNKRNNIINKIGDFIKWYRIKSDENRHTNKEKDNTIPTNINNEITKSNKRKSIEDNQNNIIIRNIKYIANQKNKKTNIVNNCTTENNK